MSGPRVKSERRTDISGSTAVQQRVAVYREMFRYIGLCLTTGLEQPLPAGIVIPWCGIVPAPWTAQSMWTLSTSTHQLSTTKNNLERSPVKQAILPPTHYGVHQLNNRRFPAMHTPFAWNSTPPLHAVLFQQKIVA